MPKRLIDQALRLNIARPHEYFLGYVDGEYYAQCRCADAAGQLGVKTGEGQVLAEDQAFTTLVGSVSEQVVGRYAQPEIGEIRYIALPVSVAGDPSRGVIVAAFQADAERADADGVARIMLAVGAATMLLATAAAWLVAGRILRPLHDVAETARTITDSDISRRIRAPDVSTGDELDDLIRTINGMLDRVEAGVAAQRRFVDDAGHELRTPITIVRGHLDVLDPGDPADLRDTLALVDDELERMNRMVSDLLLLAKSEQPTFLQPRPVDVGALTRSIFDKVRQLGAARLQPRGGRRGDGGPGSAADHAGRRRAHRQRLPVHRRRRPDQDRLRHRRKHVAVLRHRRGPRCQRGGPDPHLRALRPRQARARAAPRAPVWG